MFYPGFGFKNIYSGQSTLYKKFEQTVRFSINIRKRGNEKKRGGKREIREEELREDKKNCIDKKTTC